MTSPLPPGTAVRVYNDPIEQTQPAFAGTITSVRFNASRMFSHREPWDCSNSVANLGPKAAAWTWGCALEVARDYQAWLVSPLSEALDFVRDWARETGAWKQAEIQAWTQDEALALLVQNVASELRELGADDQPLEKCRAGSDSQVNGHYWEELGELLGEMYL